jgi:hypothetical protein
MPNVNDGRSGNTVSIAGSESCVHETESGYLEGFKEELGQEFVIAPRPTRLGDDEDGRMKWWR